MSMLRFGIAYVVMNIFALLAIAFLLENAHPEHLTYFGFTRPVNLAVILAGSAVFGFLLCLLLFMPGRIALSFHAWGLDREAEQLEQQVAHLRGQREDLLDRLDQMVDGHERILRRYHQLIAEHREVVADRDRLRAVVGTITALVPVPEGKDDTGQYPSPAPEENSATAVAVEESAAAAPVVTKPKLTRRLLPFAVS